jgi:hypothetical protein
MANVESPDADKTFEDSIAYVRRVLEPRVVRDSVWATLAAALFFMICALGFAVVAITAPPVTLTAPAMPSAPPL